MATHPPFLFLRRRAEEAAAAVPALKTRAEKAAASVLAGDHPRRRAGPAGDKFWKYREYDPSDRPQDIDWRQSARGDRIFIRQKEWQTPQTALFWCRRDGSMDYASRADLPSKQEDALVLTLALAILMEGAGDLVGLADGSLRPSRAEAAIGKMALHFFESETGALPDPALMNLPSGAEIVLAGDFLSPPEETGNALRALRARAGGLTLIQVMDPAELSLPFEGRVTFESPGGGARHTAEHVPSIRGAYESRIRTHIDDVKSLCRRHGCRWIFHTTDRDVRDTLLDAWRMMAPHDRQGGS